MSMKSSELDAVAEGAEKLAELWSGLSPEQQSQVLSAGESAGELFKPGTEDQSEFQRSSKILVVLGAALEVAAIAAGLSVALAPIAPVLSVLGALYGVLGIAGKQLTPERVTNLGAWLSTKAPRFHALLCERPELFYGLAYGLNPEGPWYLLSSCPAFKEESGMLTAGEVVSPDELLSEFPTGYPSWADESSSSSSSSSSKLLLLGAAVLPFLF